MGYNIYFLRALGLEKEEVEQYIFQESTNPSHPGRVSTETINFLIAKLQEANLVFQTFEENNGLQLQFSTYQLYIYSNYSSLVLPYWEESFRREVWEEIQTIISIYLDHGFIGWNPQAEDFVVDISAITKGFSVNMARIERIMANVPMLSRWAWGIVIGVILLVMIGLILIS